jgi:N6-L-threonylcarbamoyladenine synthase
MITLGIETSCDETAVSIIKNKREILSNIILSQTNLHKYFGGVVPELACRKHLEVLNKLTIDAIEQAKISFKNIDLIAVTFGPGLMGALLVGLSYAKSLAYRLKIPLIGVNHIEAHLYANFLENKNIKTPCIGLVVSGGHTTLLEIKNIGKYKILGQTLDDAAGEAFDKVAKLLKLGYPGGPVIDKLSQKGNSKAVKFPRAMLKQENYNFSLSGLKTAVVYYVKGFSQYSKQMKNRNIKTPDIVASFQEAVIDQLIKKTVKAMEDTHHKTIILGGGVSRNSRLRESFAEEAKKRNWKLFIPSPLMCTDNAAMIAGLGYTKFKQNGPSSMDLDAVPNLEL